MLKDTIDCAEIKNFLLRDLVTRRRVVVFMSGVSDVRGITRLLGQRRIPHCLVLMRLEDLNTRERFHLLAGSTHWPYLPQVFIDGEFVGGDLEFYEHPLVARPSRRRHPFRLVARRS